FIYSCPWFTLTICVRPQNVAAAAGPSRYLYASPYLASTEAGTCATAFAVPTGPRRSSWSRPIGANFVVVPGGIEAEMSRGRRNGASGRQVDGGLSAARRAVASSRLHSAGQLGSSRNHLCLIEEPCPPRYTAPRCSESF